MKLLLQRVTKAKVTTLQKEVKIKKGVVIFVAFQLQDTSLIVGKMVQKFFNIHYFSGDNNQVKRSIEEQKADILIVSQFTLYADVKKGSNPSWHRAASGKQAKNLYDLFCKQVIDYYPQVKNGVFGAYMEVELTNDGPFTLLLDSSELFPHS